MKKINYILTVLLVGGSVSLNAQRPEIAAETQLPDTLSIGYQMNTSARTSSYSINGEASHGATSGSAWGFVPLVFFLCSY